MGFNFGTIVTFVLFLFVFPFIADNFFSKYVDDGDFKFNFKNFMKSFLFVGLGVILIFVIANICVSVPDNFLRARYETDVEDVEKFKRSNPVPYLEKNGVMPPQRSKEEFPQKRF